VAMSLFVVKGLAGIERPAMCTALPTRTGSCLLLDLGANVDCSAEQLHQFALMGAALAASEGVANPRVGLLNIGAENAQGNEPVKQASQLMGDDSRLNYCCFFEGNNRFNDGAVVVVGDGCACDVS